MTKNILLAPEALAQRLSKRYANKRIEWLMGKGSWPLTVALGVPTQDQAKQHVSQVKTWQQAWLDWTGCGTLSRTERRWPDLGQQLLPESLTLESAAEVARIAGKSEEWQRLNQRFSVLTSRWPALTESSPASMNAIASWNETDFEIFLCVLEWLLENQGSNFYLRQLPIAGVDSKWLETRQAIVRNFLRVLRGMPDEPDFYTLAGLRRLPVTLHLRLLDPRLRARVGGIGDLQIPASELASLQLPVEKVFIVENLQTGLAFGDLPGAVVFMKQGYAVDLFGQLPWLRNLSCFYWGDLDTHGFAILDRIKQYLPEMKSLLMDRETLLLHRELWGIEPGPRSANLPRLSSEERAMYQDLANGVFGSRVRLEQERVHWGHAWQRICDL